MNNYINKTITGIPVHQNKQDFVVSVFKIGDILKFTKYTNRLIIGLDEVGAPIYNDEIQRHVEMSRVRSISKFLIEDPDATFPTNLVLHIPREIINSQTNAENTLNIEINELVFNEIQKENGDVYITIIDGQHRIRGIELAIEQLTNKIRDYEKTSRSGSNDELDKKIEYYRNRLNDLKKIELVVTFFIDKTLEYQAMIFSTINRTQKKVSADLVSSLFGLNTDDSPQKTALQIVLRLNGHEKSSFYNRIKLYGGSYDRNQSPPLSQSAMVNSLLRLISVSLREAETDRYKSRKELGKKPENSNKFLPFRKYYANNEDHIISDILHYYFKAVELTFLNKEGHSYWNFNEDHIPTNILQTTVGYDSLLKILVDILEINNIVNISDYFDFFKNCLVKVKNLDITDTNRYSFNNRGKKFFYLDMSLCIFPPSNKKSDDKRCIELTKMENGNE